MRKLFLIVPLALGIPVLSATAANAAGSASGTVTGQAFRDYDASGSRNGAEPGVAGVTVTAVDGQGTPVGVATTGPDGQYTLVVSNAASNAVRVAFTNLPKGAVSGPKGTESGTTVQFVTLPATGVSLGVNDPGDYCQQNPSIATTCFRGLPTGAGIVDFPMNAGTTSLTSNANVTNPTTSTLSVDVSLVGAVRGLAYNRTAQKLYSTAFAKTGAPYGPGGANGIYVTDRTSGATAPLGVTIAADGPIAHPATSSAIDPDGATSTFWNAVGREAFGDVDINSSDTTLFTSNMLDGRIYSISLDGAGAATGSAVLPAPTLPAACGGAVVPGALKWTAGGLLAGFTCTGPDTNSLHGYVFRYDDGAGTPTLVGTVPLNYTRGCVYAVGCSSASWNAWTSTPTTLIGGLGVSLVAYPQPWLSDIEVTETGSLILGVADRFGDQSLQAGARTLTGSSYAGGEGIAAGDTIRLTLTNGTYQLDSAYTLGGTSSSAAPDPLGGERFPATGGFHDEISLGSLAYRLGSGQLMATAMDPAPLNAEVSPGVPAINSGGVLWLDAVSGERLQSYVVFDLADPATFGKSNGLGDLELLCDRAPIEIGNRVWLDANGNGQQDAEETPIAGVTVRLYDGDLLLGTTTTAADGTWYFNDANVLGGVKPNRDYTVKLDNPADKGTGPLKDLVTTTTGAGGATDSNAVDMNGVPAVMFRTGPAGSNDHTLDIGVRPPAVNPQPALTIKKYVLREGGNPEPNNPTNPDWLDAQTAADAARYSTAKSIPFLVVATNTGNVDILNAVISSPELGACNRSAADIPGLARIAPGATIIYTCNSPVIVVSGTCTIRITGTPASGGPDLTAGDPVFYDFPAVLPQPPVVPEEGLPATGSEAAILVAIGTVLIAIGTAMSSPARRRRRALVAS